MSPFAFIRISRVLRVAAAIGVASLSAVSVSHAATLFSTGFEAPTYTTGDLNGQDDWFSLSFDSSTNTVISNNGNQMLKLGLNSYSSHFVEYTPAANERVVVSGDLARTASDFQTSSSTFGFTVYSSEGTSIARFGLAKTNAISNTLSLLATTRSSSGSALALILDTNLPANTFYNVRGEFDFNTKTWDIYNGATLLHSNLAFLDPAATGLGDAAITSSVTTSGAGYIDNFSVSTAVTVPETNTIMLLGIGIAPIVGMVIARRRKKA